MIAPIEQVVGDEVSQLQKTVSASRLNCWLQCRLKFFFRYVLKLTKPKTAALHYGSVVHLVLQQWNMARWRKQAFDLAKLKQVFDTGWTDQGQIDWDGEEPDQKTSAWNVLERYFTDTPIKANEMPEAIGDNVFAFDLLELDGVDIRSWPYRERLAALMNLLFSVQQRVIKLAETAFTTEQKLDLLKRLKAGKREGVVFKQLYAAYTSGRPNSGGNQLKHKFVATLSALVSRVNQQRSVGISLLGKNGWQLAGNVTIPANHSIPRVGDIVEIRYLYAFLESDILFQPVYLGKRDDVDPGECHVRQLKYKPITED